MSNNYRGGGGRSSGGRGGGGGGRNPNYRGSGGGGGGGRYQGGRGRGGGRSGGGGGGGGSGNPLYNPCHSYTNSGNCAHGPNCKFAHIVTLHKVFDASSFVPTSNHHHNNNNNNRFNNNNSNSNTQKAPVSSVAIWEMNGVIQIFTGSHDGFWRMWNTANGAFNKQAETSMKGKVECIHVFQNSFLYCGFEAISKILPDAQVGMVNAWNLQNTAQPLELQMDPQHLPYAHNQAVTAMAVSSSGETPAGSAPGAPNPVIVATGARDGSIRLWALSPEGAFNLVRTLPGHSREVTGLVIIPGGRLLWSSSTDGSIRIWDLTQTVPEKSCQYCITRETPGQLPNTNNTNNTPGGAPTGVGHTSAVTSLIAFNSPAGTFILSASLDGSIKAWDSNTGACVANESHPEGVVTLALANAAQPPQPQAPSPQQPTTPPDSGEAPQVLLIGLESGNVACRNLIQTQNTPAFQLLFVLSQKYAAGHSGPVKSITAGPAATFYSGGNDGNVMVWQFTGDLRL